MIQSRTQTLPLAIALLILPVVLFAQNRNEWTVYSALTRSQAVAFDRDGDLWAATTGGVVRYSPDTDSAVVYRTSEGLLRLNSTAIAVDSTTGDVYVGSIDGTVSMLRGDGRWSYSTEIASATSHPDRRINGFGFHGGKAYFLTAFGVAVYTPGDSSIRESYLRYASYPENTGINDILFWNGSIWLATDRGVVTAPMSGRNLESPGAWDTTRGLDGKRALSLAVAGDKLIVGTINSNGSSGGAYELGADLTFTQRADLPSGDPIRFASSGGTVIASSRYRTYRFDGSVFQPHPRTTVADIIDVTTNRGEVGIAVVDRSFAIVEPDSVRMIELNTPSSNQFVSLALGDGGDVWVAHWFPGAGVSRLSDSVWTRFTPGSIEAVSDADAWHVSTGADSSIWVGMRGGRGGFGEIKSDGESLVSKRYSHWNSPLTLTLSNDTSYISGSAAVADNNGRTWLINWSPVTSGTLLVVKLRDDEVASAGREFEAYSVPHFRDYRSIAIDANGTKWLGGPGTTGLTYYNDRGTLADRGDDAIPRRFTTSDGLLDNSQSSLAIDRDGLLWIGSPKGLIAITNPTSVVNNDARPSFQRLRQLNDVIVKAIVVDALNRKWVGTDRGVYVVSSDGTEVLEQFTAANSPLVSDDVLSLLSVEATGDVYIGTSNGMNRVSTVAVRSESESSERLSVSPHPFILPATEPLRIAGLPENSVVKILTLSGMQVRQFQSPGGAVAFWDGRDDRGELAPSGVYIIAAGDPIGGSTAIGKVAVVRP